MKKFRKGLILVLIIVLYLCPVCLSSDNLRVSVGQSELRSRDLAFQVFKETKIERELGNQEAVAYLKNRNKGNVLVLNKETMECELVPANTINQANIGVVYSVYRLANPINLYPKFQHILVKDVLELHLAEDPDNSLFWPKDSEKKFASDMRILLQEIHSDGTGLLDEHGVENLVIYHRAMRHRGAISTYISDLMKELLSRNRKVTIHLLYYNYDPDAEFSQVPISDSEGNIRLLLYGIPISNLTTPEIRDNIKIALESIQPATIDLIIGHDPRPSSTPLLEFASKKNIPIVTYYHGGQIKESTLGHLQRSTLALTNSEAFRDIFRIFGVRVDVLPYLVHFSRPGFLEKEDHEAIIELKREHKLEDRTIVLCPSRYDPEKGQADILEAATILKTIPEYRDLVFVFMGAESKVGYLKELREMAYRFGLVEGEDILFLGFQPKAQLRLWYEMADIGLCPSVYKEPFGLVSAEMQLNQIPVVVYKNGGLVETVKDGETGIVTSENTPEKIAEAISFLVEDEARREEMGAKAVEFIRKKFSIETVIKKSEETMIEALLLHSQSDGSNTDYSFSENSLVLMYDLFEGEILRKPTSILPFLDFSTPVKGHRELQHRL